MHISEGIIVGKPAAEYTAAALILVGYGARKMREFVREHPEKKPLLGMAGAFIFFLSLIPLPAFTGTCSHPCGSPLAGIILGPWIGITLSALSLLLQAAFFAHGGFSTWGANVFSLGVGGAFFGWLSFKIARKAGLPLLAAGMIGGLVGDVMTYALAGLSLSAVIAGGPDPKMTFTGYLGVVYAAYLPTQAPLAIGEMILTGLVLTYVYRQRPDILEGLKVVIPRATALVLVGAMVLVPATELLAQEPGEDDGMLGMDEVVNEAYAEDAGLPARDPYIDLEAKGDLWNAMMMLAGAACGFIVGRGWERMFGKKVDEKKASAG